MREQPVDRAIEIAAVRPDDARDIGDDRGRNLESLMHQLGGGYACFENFDPQRLVLIILGQCDNAIELIVCPLKPNSVGRRGEPCPLPYSRWIFRPRGAATAATARDAV